MAETCVNGMWLWHNMMSDLEKQGLKGVMIDPFTLGEDGHGIGGETNDGIKFYVTWLKDHFLLISMTKKSQAIIDAFSKVLEYKPFAEYFSCDNGLYTVEWDKKDPKGRFKELKEKGEQDLRRIDEI